MLQLQAFFLAWNHWRFSYWKLGRNVVTLISHPLSADWSSYEKSSLLPIWQDVWSTGDLFACWGAGGVGSRLALVGCLSPQCGGRQEGYWRLLHSYLEWLLRYSFVAGSRLEWASLPFSPGRREAAWHFSRNIVWLLSHKELEIVGTVRKRKGGIKVCFFISWFSAVLDAPSCCSCHGRDLGTDRGTLICE